MCPRKVYLLQQTSAGGGETGLLGDSYHCELVVDEDSAKECLEYKRRCEPPPYTLTHVCTHTEEDGLHPHSPFHSPLNAGDNILSEEDYNKGRPGF